ncbi:aromatic-L-amino-acid decarboxylase isoform X1 [Hydra vulgaris]|uniref:aromatic-L-amino-acid decarboxylase isoform X1 n=2 Tax=Hydra vulgaris TaxID=6087 RepID=UPI001F5F8C29|nr:aromatic-L-amino-acid decarboxylase isoform X1 [Hydra vulgaris]
MYNFNMKKLLANGVVQLFNFRKFSQKQLCEEKIFGIEEFKKFSKEMIDYVANYYENVEDRKVLPKIKPGYLKSLIPSKAPVEPDKWENIMDDIEKVIMPGVTHWRHPHFHAFYPTANSFPSVVADILVNALSAPGFSWISMPVSTELEMVMMDWIADLIGLPQYFKFSSNSTGGGVIQSFASDATYLTLILARSIALSKKSNKEAQSKLVMYTSSQANYSVIKAALLAGVKLHYVDTDSLFRLDGTSLAKAIKKDKECGFVPFYLCANLGTTTSCAFDRIEELGPICNKENIWLHVDAAYAGSSFVCEENRHFMKGIELVDSFNFNLHKWMLVNMDCSALWLKDKSKLSNAFNVEALYLHDSTSEKIPQYRHWQIPLARRFRSLKIWFTLRLYGQKGIQSYIRNHIELARRFEELVRSDERFEICYPVTMGLVCFRIKGSNELNEKLNMSINSEGSIFITPSKLGDKYILRFVVTYEHANLDHINYAWDVIKKHAELL